MEPGATLTSGPVGRTLARLTGPMVLGIFSIVAFNLADTYFVSRLGTEELAAMGFTFPVVMLVGSIALGLGIGTASVVSRAIGAGDVRKVRRLTTDCLALSVLVVAVFVVAGLLTITPLFTLLGAGPSVLPLIRDYMTIWYVGMAFVVVPMVGNNAIRASGDTLQPGLIMMASALVNVALDPLLIFGLLGMPRLELRGAALATVIARASSLTLTLAILHFGKRMLDFSLPRLKDVWDSWRRMLFIALPAAGTNVLVPLSTGVLTRLMAQFGEPAVAAFGTGTRVARFALIVVVALSSVIVPFVGQNWAAGRRGRVRLARRLATRFSFAWGAGCLVALVLFAGAIARCFSDDPRVISSLSLYLRIVPIGFGFQGVCHLASGIFNAINRPFSSALLNVFRTFVLCVPLALLGGRLFGLPGIFAGMVVANVIAGTTALVWIKPAVNAEDTVPSA